MRSWCDGYCRREMSTMNPVQIVDEAAYILHSAWKNINPPSLPLAMGK